MDCLVTFEFQIKKVSPRQYLRHTEKLLIVYHKFMCNWISVFWFATLGNSNIKWLHWYWLLNPQFQVFPQALSPCSSWKAMTVFGLGEIFVYLPGNNLVVIWGFQYCSVQKFIRYESFWLQSWFCFVFNDSMKTHIVLFVLTLAVVLGKVICEQAQLERPGRVEQRCYPSVCGVELLGSNLLFPSRLPSVVFFLLVSWFGIWNVCCSMYDMFYHSCVWNHRWVQGMWHRLLRAPAAPAKTCAGWNTSLPSVIPIPLLFGSSVWWQD